MDDTITKTPDYEPIQNLITTLLGTGKKYDIDKIKRAFVIADELHAGQFRVSGEPYISHPIAVAEIVAGLELDTDSICAALLHDTVEDTPVTLEQIRAEFGEEVARLVGEESSDKTRSWEECKSAVIARIKAASREEQMLTLSDKLANMRSIAYDYAREGDEAWKCFKRGYDKQKWYYTNLKEAFSALADVEEYREFAALVDSVFVK